MQFNAKLPQITVGEKNQGPKGPIKKNKKWPPFWALLLDQDLIHPNPMRNDIRLLLQTVRMTVQLLEEAARVRCNCYYSRRMKRWVFYRERKWELNSELKRIGVEINRIGNRDADYAEILGLSES